MLDAKKAFDIVVKKPTIIAKRFKGV